VKLQIAILLLSACVFGQQRVKPTIKPYFDRIDDGPTFMLECQNTDKVKISSLDSRWPMIGQNTVRIDETTSPDFTPDWGATLSTDVAPGATWKGIFALRQSSKNYYPAVRFGAITRFAVTHQISPGQHTIAVQCYGVWSDDLTFYWDPDIAPDR
jgi:hypothetical protein